MAALRLAALAFGLFQAVASGDNGAPFYSAQSIVNAASNTPTFAPYSFVTIYGTNLAEVTRQMTSEDIHAGLLPTTLEGTGVSVIINGILANIYYVSPNQVNLLIPPLFLPGPVNIQLVFDGLAGPAIALTLQSTAPALFQADAVTALATHADGSLVNSSAPAHAGEIIVLWANGLGTMTVPPPILNLIPENAAPLEPGQGFQVLLNSAPVDAGSILYAGNAPGYAGLFQINVQLPVSLASNPQIQLVVGNQTSPAGIFLATQ